MFKPDDEVIYRGQKCLVIYELGGVASIKMPDGKVVPVRADKLKRPEEF